MDVDNFKRVNDSHGHSLGDDVLLMASRSITSVLWQLGTLIRWGGDEFLILLPNVTKEGLQIIAERIQVFVERSFITIEDKQVAVTASLEATNVQKQYTLDVIIKRADFLLYESKRNGRNKITFDY